MHDSKVHLQPKVRRDSRSKGSENDRYTASANVAINTIWGNLGLFIVKGAVGLSSGSTALLADALHSLSDILSTVVVLFGMKVAAVPPDPEHPYGHGRAESIAAKILALMLIAVGLGMVYTAVDKLRFFDGTVPSAAALVAAFVSILGKEAMYWYAVSTGKKYNNRALIADAWHHRSDAMSSVAALIGIGLARAGYHLVDPLSALIVAAVVIYTAARILRESIDELMDSQKDSGFIQRLKDLTGQVQGCLHVDSLHIRRYGGSVVVDVGISVSGNLSVTAGHDVAHAVKHHLVSEVEEVVDVMVHVNPVNARTGAHPAVPTQS